MSKRCAALASAGIVVIGLVTVFGATAAHAAASCSYDGTTDTMTVSMPTPGLYATIGRTGVDLTVDSVACGNAKVGNTDQIVVNGAAGRQSLEITLQFGAIGPGTSAESDTPEIEITPHLGAGTDKLYITGSAGSDNIRVGSTGVNLNGDTDRDVTYDGVDTVSVSGGEGGDVLSAVGGLGTGSVFARPISILGQDGADTVTGGGGRDSLYGGAGTDDITGGDGDDYLYGSDQSDELDGGGGDDYLYGEGGIDTLDGADGDDVFSEDSAANGGDTMHGGTGNDSVNYYSRSNPISVTLNGTANDGEAGENDNVNADVEGVTGSWTAANTFVGSSLANTFSGGMNNDEANGGGGKDILYGNPGTDHLRGGSDDDSLYGGDGTDTIEGDADDDSLYGGNDADIVRGGNGDDFLNEDFTVNGADDLSGGGGHDAVTYGGRTADITVTLDSAADDGELGEGDRVRTDVEDATGGQAKNRLIGSTADNGLYSPYGTTAADFINGGGGADYLYGYGGADTILGGDGEDSIYAGDGDDTLKIEDGGYDYADGGPGTDVAANQDAGVDTLVSVP